MPVVALSHDYHYLRSMPKIHFSELGCAGYFEARWKDTDWKCSLDTLHTQAQAWKDQNNQYGGRYEKSLAVVQTLDLSHNDLIFVIRNVRWNRELHDTHFTLHNFLRESCSVLLFYCHNEYKEIFAGDSPCKCASLPCIDVMERVPLCIWQCAYVYIGNECYYNCIDIGGSILTNHASLPTRERSMIRTQMLLPGYVTRTRS